MDLSVRELVKKVLAKPYNMRYQKMLADRQVSYEAWLRNWEAGIRLTEAPSHLPSPLVIFYSRQGELSEYAIQYITCYFVQNPEAQIVYGDEDVRDKRSRAFSSPWFKPDWSPDTFLSFYYFGSVTAVRKELLDRCGWAREEGARCKGELEDSIPERSRPVEGMTERAGIRVYPYPEGEEWLRLVIRLVTAAGGFQRSCRAIGHINGILFHSCSGEAQRRYLDWKPEAVFPVRPEQGEKKKLPMEAGISVVIPSRDNPELLRCCLESLLRAKGHLPVEAIVVDNGSGEENRRRLEELFSELRSGLTVLYMYTPMDFHFSRMCNLGAEKARGRFLLFLNDDAEIICTGSLDKMARRCASEYTGAVGLKLYYPDSRRIQHDGIVNLPMGPVHKLQFLEDDEDYCLGWNRFERNALAVTGACLMVEACKFREAGGFSDQLPVAFNDVELCFSLFERGWHNLVLNSVCAYHHESLSRGDDESAEKLERLGAELEKLYLLHPELEGRDPYYSYGWNHDGLDTRIRPAYLTAGNRLQKLKPDRMDRLSGKVREDACLLVRVEACRKGGIQGYGVILGDNNACYEKWLLFQREKPAAGTDSGRITVSVGAGFGWIADGAIWKQRLDGQYRPDLVENMPDQQNVGFCGFTLHLVQDALPAGVYRIGMLARNRITGLRLIHWTNRRLILDGTERQETT